MLQLIRCEFYKFWHNQKNCLILFLVFAYLVGLLFMNQTRQKEFKQSRDSLIGADLQEAMAMVIAYDKNYRTQKTAGAKEVLEFWKQRQAIVQEISANYRFYSEENVLKLLKLEIELAENERHGYQRGYFYNGIGISAVREQELNRIILTNQYFIDHAIIPQETPYQLSGAQFLYLLISDIVPLGFLVFIFLFSMDIYSSETEYGSYKFLYTQQFTRKSILSTKFIVSFFSAIMAIVTAIAVAWFLISCMYGTGDYNYPVAIMEAHGNYAMVELQIIIIHGYILLCLILLFMQSMVLGIAVYCESTPTTFSLVTLILLITYCIDKFQVPSILKKAWLLANYSVASKIVYQGIRQTTFTALILVVASVLFVFITQYKVAGQDFTGGRES